MIPKTIHYIWLGGEKLPVDTLMIIQGWKRKLSDYKIQRWDESNLPIEKLKKENFFFKKCCDYKLWAFMSDYIRLWILYNNGGIYLDTDVEVVKKFDSILDNPGFMGFEAGDNKIGEYIGSGIIGAQKNNSTIKKLLDFYDEEVWNEKEYVNTIIFKKQFLRNSEMFDEMKILPRIYFSIFSPYEEKNWINEDMQKQNIYTIHWYNSNWGMSLRGYLFITTKFVHNPVFKVVVIIKRTLGYIRRKLEVM